MIKKILLIMAAIALTVGTTRAQYVAPPGDAGPAVVVEDDVPPGPVVEDDDGYWHPHGFPPGIPGGYNNPIRVHADLGQQVFIGDYGLGLTDPWYVITGWWDNPQGPGSGHLHNYLDVFGQQYRGQFLIKRAEVTDYNYGNHGLIYAVADYAHGLQLICFRIIANGP